MSWLLNLNKVKNDKKVSNRWIAEHSSVPQKTVERIFAGDTDSPKFDTIRLICAALGVSIDDIASDTMTVLGSKTLAVLQEEVDFLTAEVERLNNELASTNAENAVLRDRVITAENNLKDTKLTLQEEIIAVHNYYIKQRSNFEN